MKKIIIATLLLCWFLIGASEAKSQSRIKDLASIENMDSMPLIGYGLIVGLAGTGDTPRTLFANQTLLNLLDRFGISVDSERIRVKNVAGVMVTAELPPFVKEGQRLDVTISSLGDARSLSGGTLLLTPLIGLDEEVYGVAQGPISLGGFMVESGGVSVSQNHPLVCRIPDGFHVEKTLNYTLADLETFRYALHQADFTTSTRIAEAINRELGREIASPLDPITVEVRVVPDFPGGIMGLIAATEVVSIEPDVKAKVVVNERTGTVVIGGNVKLSNVAVTHGALSISIETVPVISQPGAFSAGKTVTEQVTQIRMQQEGMKVNVIPESNNVQDVAAALNSLGVTPRDIISIFQALKETGALQAELIII